MLEALTEKSKQPDAAPVGKSLTAHVNLSNKEEVALAVKYGFLPGDDDDDADDDEDDDAPEETPKRKGFFE
jgi:hypothetical protein